MRPGGWLEGTRGAELEREWLAAIDPRLMACGASCPGGPGGRQMRPSAQPSQRPPTPPQLLSSANTGELAQTGLLPRAVPPLRSPAPPPFLRISSSAWPPFLL